MFINVISLFELSFIVGLKHIRLDLASLSRLDFNLIRVAQVLYSAQ